MHSLDVPPMSASAMTSLKALFSPSEEQLMWRVQMEDDPHAFAELVRRWEVPIQRLCARMTGDSHRAEDLAQEAFARLFSRRKAYRGGAKFSSYLWRIALNLCYDELRRVSRRREAVLDEGLPGEGSHSETLASTTPGPDEEVASEESGAVVRQAVTALPEQYRSIIVLRHYENLKFREIADILELPEGTVKTRMTEALNLLARLLKNSLDVRTHVPANRRERPKQTLVL